MEKEKGKLYQDRIYGAKVLSPLAVELIDTAEFQRLAGLRQLGFADLVYRGAIHTRFEHSVGTYFMCRTIMRRIVQNHERLGFNHPGRLVSKNFAMYPAASVSGFYFSHPDSQYFNLGKLLPDQIQDYAKRKNMSTEQIKKLLPMNI